LDQLAAMKLPTAISSFFRMTDEVWRRHANPRSVYTRFAAIPAIRVMEKMQLNSDVEALRWMALRWHVWRSTQRNIQNWT
jgi:hypothetical protein